MNKPKIIAFEGIDGSGKETQCKLLCDHIESLGRRVVIASYPQYSSFIGREIGRLLSATDPLLSAKTLDSKSMALWYALDRWAHFEANTSLWNNAEYVLLNRSTMSSMVYQSLRSETPENIVQWVEELEFEVLHLPRPDLFVIFDVSPISSAQNMKKKSSREYTASELDVYEGDSSLQIRSWRTYRRLACDRADSALIGCEDGKGQLLDIGAIFEKVRLELTSRSLL